MGADSRIVNVNHDDVRMSADDDVAAISALSEPTHELPQTHRPEGRRIRPPSRS
jgi:hypothetical protein